MPKNRLLGYILLVIGILIAFNSEVIVFPGLERLLGPETIVGERNVIREPGGGVLLTNPGAMILWIGAVALVGIGVAAAGGILLCETRTKSPQNSA